MYHVNLPDHQHYWLMQHLGTAREAARFWTLHLPPAKDDFNGQRHIKNLRGNSSDRVYDRMKALHGIFKDGPGTPYEGFGPVLYRYYPLVVLNHGLCKADPEMVFASSQELRLIKTVLLPWIEAPVHAGGWGLDFDGAKAATEYVERMKNVPQDNKNERTARTLDYYLRATGRTDRDALVKQVKADPGVSRQLEVHTMDLAAKAARDFPLILYVIEHTLCALPEIQDQLRSPTMSDHFRSSDSKVDISLDALRLQRMDEAEAATNVAEFASKLQAVKADAVRKYVAARVGPALVDLPARAEAAERDAKVALLQVEKTKLRVATAPEARKDGLRKLLAQHEKQAAELVGNHDRYQRFLSRTATMEDKCRLVELSMHTPVRNWIFFEYIYYQFGRAE